VKIGPVDPEIALLNLKKKKEINASKIDSPSGKFAERAKKRKKKKETVGKIYSPSGNFSERAKKRVSAKSSDLTLCLATEKHSSPYWHTFTIN